MTSLKLQWPNISCHVWTSCETLTVSHTVQQCSDLTMFLDSEHGAILSSLWPHWNLSSAPFDGSFHGEDILRVQGYEQCIFQHSFDLPPIHIFQCFLCSLKVPLTLLKALVVTMWDV